MKPPISPHPEPPDAASDEIADLITTLHETGQRLEKLIGSEVDAVTGLDGRPFILQGAQERLRLSDAAKQSAILNALPAHIALLDSRGVILAVNEAWRQFATENELLEPEYGVGLNYLEICDAANGLDAEEAPQVCAGIRSVLAGDVKSYTVEYPCHSPTEQRWFLLTVTPQQVDQSHGVVVMHLNITQRKVAEQQAQRHAQLYAALSECSKAIVKCTSANELFAQICRAAVQLGGMKMAWVGLIDTSNLTVQPVASFGDDSGYLKDLDISTDINSPFGRGPTGTAIRKDQPYWCQDFLQDQATTPWRQRAVQAGLAAAAALPLHRNGMVVGTFNLYSNAVDSFDELARGLLANMARDISFALDNFDHQLQRKQAEEQTILANTILQTQQDTSLDAILVVNVSGQVLSFNQQFIELWRLPAQLLNASVDAPVLQAVVDLVENPEAFVARVKYLYEHLEEKSHEEIPLKDGRIVDRYSAPIAGTDGQIYGRVWYFRDITERTQAQVRITFLNRVYAMLSGINALIVRVRDRDELYREACRIAVEVGGFRTSMLCIVDRDTKKIVPVASAGKDDVLLTSIKGLLSSSEKAPKTMVAQAIRHQKAVVSNNMQSDSRVFFGKKYAESGIFSMAIFPLIVANEAVGALTLYSSESDFFHADELKLLTELTSDISFAFDHIGQEEKIDHLNRIQAFSSAINALIVRVKNRQELFNETCRIAVEYGHFGTAWVGVLDPSTHEIEQVAQYGQNLRPTGEQVRIDVATGQGIASRAIRTKRPVFDNDIAAASTAMIAERGALAIQAGFRSRIALPFMVEGAVVGHLSLYAKDPDYFNEDEVKLLTEMAANMSFALDHIGKNEKISRLSRIQLVMSRVNALIVHARNHNELFSEACQIAVEQGGFRMAMIALADQSAIKFVPVAWAGKDQELMGSIKSILSSVENAPKTMVARAIRGKTIILSNDSQKDPGVVFKKQYTDSGVRSMAVFPLIAMNEAIGVLALYSNEINFFDEEETRLLTELVNNVAFAHDFISKQERLDYLAFYDPLTGLAKRNLFLDRVTQYMRSAAGNGRKLALFMIDLERFKNINDSLGRPAGDAILLQVAKWLTRLAGNVSLVARLDADHFAAVMPEVNPGGNLPLLIEKAMAAVLMHPFSLNGDVFRIAVKVGVALFPDDGTDAEILFRNAEAALKKAKAGGDRYLFHTHQMTEAVASKLTLENQLRRALDNEEFVLHYQPKVNLVSGRMTGAEALIRWNDPATGLVPPGRFIPILEETGLIYEVGRWAITTAIKDYLRWRNAGLPAVRIAVNVSPLQLKNLGFVSEIRKATAIHPYAAEGLELEITESLIMKDVSQNITALQAIRDMGVKISIDDFGTGFSSLSYLARLPVDTLKIDRSFVNDMTEGPEKLALVSTIINLAHSLNLKVVAEGVETEEEARLLRLLACDEMQGYLFSKPVPGDIFESRFLVEPAPGVVTNPPGASGTAGNAVPPGTPA